MGEKIGLDKFCDLLSKINADFTDYILEDWESQEEGNVKLNGLSEKEWMTKTIPIRNFRKNLNKSVYENNL